MISKAKIKYIKSLQIKKVRNLNGEFVVEGAKSVLEAIHSNYEVSEIYGTEDFFYKNHEKFLKSNVSREVVREEELEAAGSFSSNNGAIAIVKMKDNKAFWIEGNEYVIVLDEVKDPGNLGTIIRIADWYGIKKIVCSEETADLYNSKVISSSMGSFTRVDLFYTSLKEYLSNIKGEAVYGALLDGKDVHQQKFASKGYILMGNEASGIKVDLFPYITQKITIPRRGAAESLNVGIATAIICDNIMR